jgi:hypothetical protein
MALGSLINGITKIFTSLGTGAATLGSAVRAVGTSLFTGMAATGTGLAGAGNGPLAGLLGGSGGVLGNILGGAIQQGLASGLVGGVVGEITGDGFGKGFKTGAITGAITGGAQGLFSPTGFASATGDTLTGAVGDNTAYGGAGADPLSGDGGLVPAATPTGTAPRLTRHAIERGRDFSLTAPAAATAATGTSYFPPTPAAPGTGTGVLQGFGGFLNSNAGGSLIAGIGEAIGQERLIEAQTENAEANRDFLREQQETRTANYDLPASAIEQESAGAKASKKKSTKPKWAYDPRTGMIDYA